jgi:CheY-like chemotaxis protein
MKGLHSEVASLRRFATAASFASLVAVACARPMSTVTAYKALPPKASADVVEVFTDVRPERPHEELGVTDVKSFGISLKADYGKLILEARQRAAQMGADAIVVTRRPVESTTTVGDASQRIGRKGGDYVESTTTSETAASPWSRSCGRRIDEPESPNRGIAARPARQPSYSMTIRVLTADDHPVVRSGIAAMIANEPDMRVIAEAGDGTAAVTLYAEHQPDVVLMDLRMPRVDGVSAIRTCSVRSW